MEHGARALSSRGPETGDVRTDCDAKLLGRLLLDAWQGAVLRSKVERKAASLDAFIDVLLPALVQPKHNPRPLVAKRPAARRRK